LPPLHDDAVKLIFRLMKERGITHTTSECTLRGLYRCAGERRSGVRNAVGDRQEAYAGHRLSVEGITGGLEVK